MTRQNLIDLQSGEAFGNTEPTLFATHPEEKPVDLAPSGRMLLACFKDRLPYVPVFYEGPEFTDLVESIRLHGVQVALTFSALGNLVDGYRRYLAALKVRLTDLPYVVNPAIDTPEKEFGATFTSETRSTRNQAAHALCLKGFQKSSGLTLQKDVAAATGISEAKLSRLYTLLTFPDDVVEAVGNGKITIAHTLAVAPLEDQARKLELIYLAMAKPMTAGKLKELAFPKKKALPHCKVDSGGLSLVVPKDMALAPFLAAWAEIKQKVEDRYKATDKKHLPVASVMAGITA